MKQKTEVIQNLKCGGCVNTIVTALNKLKGIDSTYVDLESHSVTFLYEQEDSIALVEAKLSQLGYPIDTDPNSLLKKAKSFVSCAVGRMSIEEAQNDSVE